MSVNNLSAQKSSPADPGFWEIGGYKPNLYRIRDGFDQLEDITKLLKERVEVEDKYGKSLQNWNEKWKAYVERNFPEGTIKNSLDDVLSESKELSRIHLAVKDRLNDEVVKTIGAFKDSSYHRSTIRGLKEQRDIEEKFDKAQHRWKKLWKKLEVAKKHYHSCCRAEKSAYVQMVNSATELSSGADGSEKSRERYKKCREETRRAKLAYEQQIKDISYENTAYVDKMSCVFEECQQFEFVRTKFLLEMISGIQKVFVDLVSPSRLRSIHSNLEAKFKALDDSHLKEDLKTWSGRYGTDVPHQLPTFEQYTPEFHNISSKPSEPQPHGGVILMKKKLLKSESDFEATGYGNNNRSNNKNYHHGSVDNLSANPVTSLSDANCGKTQPRTSMSTQDVYRAGLGLVGGEWNDEAVSKSDKNFDPRSGSLSISSGASTEAAKENCRPQGGTTTINSNGSVPIDTDENASVNYPAAPIFKSKLVRVLFDYKPNESDEIELVKGGLVEMFRPADDMGWCYGRNDEKTGFFPAGYVTLL